MTYFCPQCWSEVSPDQAVCDRCGVEIVREQQASTYVQKLIAALHHPERTTPVRAAWILGELKAREAVPALMDLARSSPDFFVRKAAVEALGEMRDAWSVGLLKTLVRSQSILVRRAASRALAGMKTPPPDPTPRG